jgi:triosephosphate isomerase
MFVGSWKTYKTNLNEVRAFFNELPQYAGNFKTEYEFVVCPSFIHLETANSLVPPYMKLGAQDCSAYAKGPHTGDITAEQLKSVGVKYCVIGHVERRKAGETDGQINLKIKQCLEHGITPVVCFGETLEEYDNDKTRIVLERQMRDSLLGVRDVEKMVLCYMPIWSIGTGFYTPGEYSNIIADFMRKTAVKLTGNPMSANCTILFGGQITSSNVGEYLECPEIDGVIFAIAALQPRDFAEFASTQFTTKKYQKIDQATADPQKQPEKK